MRYHAQPECYLDPGNPPVQEPSGTGESMDAPVNRWDAAVFISEGVKEVMAGMSEHDLAELTRDAQRDDALALWRDMMRKSLEYAEAQVHDVRMGYVPRRVR